MANIKISQLTPGAIPLSGTEEIPLVQGGITVKATAQDIANLGAPVVIPTLQQVLDNNHALTLGKNYQGTNA